MKCLWLARLLCWVEAAAAAAPLLLTAAAAVGSGYPGSGPTYGGKYGRN